MRQIFIYLMFYLIGTSISMAQQSEKWPEEVKEITYFCVADSSMQPALFYDPGSNVPRPLLVALHTWSGNYRQSSSIPYAQWCIKKDWLFIHPNFRGPDDHPQACGSPLAMADIQAALQWVKENFTVDTSRIYLVGTSGGGMAALLAAAIYPQQWTAVSSWVPVTDLIAWYQDGIERKNKYPEMIRRSCGGAPGESEAVDREYRLRSPLTHLAKAKGVLLDINAGIHDGYSGSVPVSHTLRAFNVLAESKDRLTNKQISFFVQKEKVPFELAEPVHDRSYGEKKPLFRRQSGNARVTIFEGGHEIIFEAALQWLEAQQSDHSH